MHWFATPIQGWQLKGNQVQILNSPAAVSFIKCRRQFTLCHWKFLLPGRRLKQKQVRRPAMHTFIIAFEEKALSLMSRTNRPIISFTKLDSKKVNKLCQVYLMVSGRSDFARTFTLQRSGINAKTR